MQVQQQLTESDLRGLRAVAMGFNSSIFFTAGLVVLVVGVFGLYTDLTNLLTTSLLICLILPLQFYLKRGWLRTTTWMMLAVLFAGVFLAMVRFGSVSIAQASMACIPIIYCVIVLGARAGALLVALSISASAVITWAKLNGQFINAAPILPLAQWGILVVGFLLAFRIASLVKQHLLDASRATNLAQLELLQVRERSSANVTGALAELESQRYVIDQHAIVVKIDLRGMITYGNQKFSEISGYHTDEFLGKSITMLRSGVHERAFFQNIVDTVNTGAAWHAETCSRSKDGSLFWMDSTIAAFLNEDGTPREYIAVNTDITQLRRAQELATSASRAKSEFLANMSHEIRTPMNGVVGMVDILQATVLTPEQRRMVDTVHNSSIALLQILNDILDFSKIEAGKLSVESIAIPLRETVEAAAQLMVNISAGKVINLALYVDPELPRLVVTDPTRLRQILFNLLSNALKFTPPLADRASSVKLRVQAAAFADGAPAMEFRIMDNGIGMTADMVEHLFEAFSQGDASTAREYGGTGLGLSITHRLVEMMRGRVSVTSTPGAGSTFTVLLPLLPGVDTSHVPRCADINDVHVLVVTADADCAWMLSKYLASAGALSKVVPDIAVAQRWLEQDTQIQVLMLDADTELVAWHYALKDNFPLLGVVQLVQRHVTPGLPGATSVTARPVTYDELVQGVAISCGRLPEVQASPMELGTPAGVDRSQTVEQARAAGRLILLVEDNETNRDVTLEQLHVLGYLGEWAADGVDGLAMWQTGNYGLVLTDCHMPRMDGFQMATAIRNAERPDQHTPIIAVTANALRGEEQRCLDSGMDEFLCKPLRLKALGAVLSRWLTAPQVWDAQALGRTLGHSDAKVHNRLLERFLRHTTQQLKEMQAHWQAADTQAVGALAHNIKSAARTVGALRLGELCNALEVMCEDGDQTGARALISEVEVAFHTVKGHFPAQVVSAAALET